MRVALKPWYEWIALVTRAGIYKLSDKGNPRAALEAAEIKVGVRFPRRYREFMSAWNGGAAKEARFFKVEELKKPLNSPQMRRTKSFLRIGCRSPLKPTAWSCTAWTEMRLFSSTLKLALKALFAGRTWRRSCSTSPWGTRKTTATSDSSNSPRPTVSTSMRCRSNVRTRVGSRGSNVVRRSLTSGSRDEHVTQPWPQNTTTRTETRDSPRARCG